jgi:hypothetical protein
MAVFQLWRERKRRRVCSLFLRAEIQKLYPSAPFESY